MQHAIALECLLGDSEINEITYKLATRCAHLLGKGAAERKEISSKVKNLYRARSKIVHEGNTDLTDLQLSDLRLYVRQALITVLTKADFQTLTSKEAFIEWFNEKILS